MGGGGRKYLIKNGIVKDESLLISFFGAKFYEHNQGSNYYTFGCGETYSNNFNARVWCLKDCFIDSDVELIYTRNGNESRGNSTIQCLQQSWNAGLSKSGTYITHCKQKIDTTMNLILYQITNSGGDSIRLIINIYGDLFYKL